MTRAEQPRQRRWWVLPAVVVAGLLGIIVAWYAGTFIRGNRDAVVKGCKILSHQIVRSLGHDPHEKRTPSAPDVILAQVLANTRATSGEKGVAVYKAKLAQANADHPPIGALNCEKEAG